jgi:hypothetical protein
MSRSTNALLRCLDCAAVLHTDSATGELVDAWGERTCSASYGAHAPDLPYLPVRTAETDTSARPRTAAEADSSPVGPGLTGADCPASRTLRAAHGGPPSGRLLDSGHPAAPVAGAPCGQADRTPPAAYPAP